MVDEQGKPTIDDYPDGAVRPTVVFALTLVETGYILALLNSVTPNGIANGISLKADAALIQSKKTAVKA